MKNVLITTEYKGVFFGQVANRADLSKTTIRNVKNCRMAIYFGTTRGVMELAETGPTEKTKISAKADIEVIHGVTAIFAVTDEATSKWLA